MENRIGFGQRFLAWLIDGIISVVGGAVIGAMLGGILGGAAGAAAGSGGSGGAAGGAQMGGLLGAMLGAVAGIAVFGTLYGLIEAFTGASPGKMILKIKIGNADGTAASVGTLFLRYVIKNIGLVCSVLALVVAPLILLGRLLGFVVFIGCFFVLGEARQALHDMIAKTAVYPRDRLAAAVVGPASPPPTDASPADAPPA